MSIDLIDMAIIGGIFLGGDMIRRSLQAKMNTPKDLIKSTELPATVLTAVPEVAPAIELVAALVPALVPELATIVEPNLIKEEPKMTTLREILQVEITNAKSELAVAEAAFQASTSKLNGIQAELEKIAGKFTAVLDNDIAEVKDLFERFTSHVSSAPTPADPALIAPVDPTPVTPTPVDPAPAAPVTPTPTV